MDGVRPRTGSKDDINPEWWARFCHVTQQHKVPIDGMWACIKRRRKCYEDSKVLSFFKGWPDSSGSHRHYSAFEKHENQGQLQISVSEFSKVYKQFWSWPRWKYLSANIGLPILRVQTSDIQIIMNT